MANRIFLSYSRADAATAHEIRGALEAARHDVWVDTEDIQGGDRWAAAIVAGIEQADSIVVLLSRHSVASDHVLTEVNLGREGAKRIIPVRLDSASPTGGLLYSLSGVQFIDYASDPKAGLGQLLHALDPARSAPPSAQPVTWRRRVPDWVPLPQSGWSWLATAAGLGLVLILGTNVVRSIFSSPSVTTSSTTTTLTTTTRTTTTTAPRTTTALPTTTTTALPTTTTTVPPTTTTTAPPTTTTTQPEIPGVGLELAAQLDFDFKLQTEFMERMGLCLEAVAPDRPPAVASCQDVPGQRWRTVEDSVPLEGVYYQLRTALGEPTDQLCLTWFERDVTISLCGGNPSRWSEKDPFDGYAQLQDRVQFDVKGSLCLAQGHSDPLAAPGLINCSPGDTRTLWKLVSWG